jgi:hypothetical protein
LFGALLAQRVEGRGREEKQMVSQAQDINSKSCRKLNAFSEALPIATVKWQ